MPATSMATKTYREVIVDTTQYAGNFELAMASYVFGCPGESEIENWHQEFDKEGRSELLWAYDPDNKSGSALVQQRDEDIGFLYWASITQTPGYINNGCGVHARHLPGDPLPKGFDRVRPAYQSVLFRFRDGFFTGHEYVQQITERVAGFPDAYKRYHLQHFDDERSQSSSVSDLFILNVRAQETTITTHTRPLTLKEPHAS